MTNIASKIISACLVLGLTACGGGSSNNPGNPVRQPNGSTPNAITFLDLSLAEPNTLVTSNTVTISGLTQPVAINISVGEYSINNGGYTDLPGTIKNGDTLAVRVMSSPQYSKTSIATITVGNLPATFRVTTVVGKFSWTDPVIIPGFTKNILYTREWADSAGNAWVIPLVGTQLGTSNYNIYALQYSETSGLSAPFPIDDTNTVEWLQTVSGDTKGNVLVLWQRNSKQYYARAYSANTHSWSEIHPVFQKTNPSRSIAMDPVVINDTFYLLSYESDAGVGNYYFQTYSDANGWSTVETIYTGGKEYQSGDWSLSVKDNGNAIFFWPSQTDAATYLMKSSRNGTNGVWSTPTPIMTAGATAVISGLVQDSDNVGNILLFNLYNGASQKYIATQDGNDQWPTAMIEPYISYIKSGDNFVFIFEIEDGGICRITSRNYARSSGFSSAQNIIESPSACPSNMSANAVMGKNQYGDITLATSIRGQDGIWVASYNGSAWQDITRVDQTAVLQANPHLKLLSDQNGRFFVLWETFANTLSGYLAAVTRDLDKKWSSEQLLETSGSGVSDAVTAVINADGIQIVWRKKPNSASGNYIATRFATGIDWGPEHPLIAKTALYPDSYNLPSVIPLPSGKMLGITYWYDGITTSAYYSEYK